MKTICILLCFALSTIQASNFHSFYQDIARFKREAAEDGSICLLSCIEAMEEQLNTIKSVRTQHAQIQQSSTCQRYEPEQLEALCGSHKEARQCLDACPDGEMRMVGMHALTPLNFMCVDRLEDFKQHLPCLDSICQSAESTCHPTCRQYQPSVDKLTEIQRDTQIRQSSDAMAVTKMVSDACEFIDCFNDCSRPLIVEKCGSGAADLQRDTVRKAFASVTNLLSTVDALPNSCHNLASPIEDAKNVTSTTSRNVTVQQTTVKATRRSGNVADVSRRGNLNNANAVQTGDSNLSLESEMILNSGAIEKFSVHYALLVIMALIIRFL